MIKAVFFDLDGVLIDSEVIEQRWTENFLKEENLAIPAERFLVLVGSSSQHDFWQEIIGDYKIKWTKEELKEHLLAYKNQKWKETNYQDLIFEDTEEVLKYLKEKGIIIVCASSSNIQRIKTILNSKNLLPYFDLIVTGDDFKESKPAPDIYLYCQDYFHLEKNECLVVEDSSKGIEAGKSAGLKVVAIKDYYLQMDQSKADYFIDHLKELLPLID